MQVVPLHCPVHMLSQLAEPLAVPLPKRGGGCAAALERQPQVQQRAAGGVVLLPHGGGQRGVHLAAVAGSCQVHSGDTGGGHMKGSQEEK